MLVLTKMAKRKKVETHCTMETSVSMLYSKGADRYISHCGQGRFAMIKFHQWNCRVQSGTLSHAVAPKTVHDRTILMARYDALREEILAVLPTKGNEREWFIRVFHWVRFWVGLHRSTNFCWCVLKVFRVWWGETKLFVAFLREHENRPILSFHYILNQEALYALVCRAAW